MNYSTPHFYILNKGLNSGRPAWELCPNCFVVLTNTAEHATMGYYIVHALWLSEYFKKILVGSVIPFLRINDLRSAVRPHLDKLDDAAGKSRYIDGVEKAHRLELHLKQQISQLAKLKLCLANQFLNT